MSTAVEHGLTSIVDRVKREIDNYQATVRALHALVSITLWEGESLTTDSHYSLGRRMDTSPNNRVAPESSVTPDAVIQQSSQLGYVAEAKKTLPSTLEYWEEDADQLHKYDDDLRGWWTPDELVRESDVVVLVGAPRAADFAEYTERRATEKGWSFAGNVCFIEFSRVEEVQSFVHVRRHHGNLTDADLAERLRKGVMVPIEKLVVTFRSRKFYDGDPPVEYVMLVLWHDIFNDLKSTAEFDEASRCWPLDVQVSQLTKELQRLFGSTGDKPREAEYPTRDWVRRALDALAQIGLAKHRGNNHYTILFRKLQGDVIERFAHHKLREKEKIEGVQLRLIGD